MTERELDLLVKAFKAFLAGETAERFLMTNRSIERIVEHFGIQLKAEPIEGQEALLNHFIAHAAAERDLLLNEAIARGDIATYPNFQGPVLTERSADALAARPSPRNSRGF